MAAPPYLSDCSGLVRICLLLGALWKIRAEQISYSVPEELEKGSFVGNIAKDLGLEPRELAERGVRIVSRGRTQLFALNLGRGSLVTAGRLDREELCDRSPKCVVNLEILLEDKVKIFGVEVEIIDVNDNAPNFGTEQREIKVAESENPGTRFPLPEAFDPDVGVNSLQGYQLSSNVHFSLDVQSGADGIKYPELVLERALDREEEAVHHLVLTAFDGGDVVHSGTTRIHVTLVDTNDNAPVFTQPEYHVSVRENLLVGSRLLTIKATDPDEGANGEVTYSFRKVRDKISQLFQLNSVTGDITILGDLDYEDSGFYEIDVEAHDGPGLRARSKVLVTVLDVNDNAPEVMVTSLTSSIQETSSPGTVIALFNVHDGDSGENGLVTCSIPNNLPFTLEKTYGNYYRLLTHKTLDREEVSEYNITVTATDHGTPPLSTDTHISLQVADINDNPPAFPHASYSAYIPENNPRGASILSLSAQDPDSIENARVTYSLAEDTLQGEPLSSYVSINSDTGVLYALRSFDYEQVRDLQLLVTASDSGDPPLSSNVSLSLFVLDQNDNAPEILYPALPTDDSTGVELAPRSAEPGYLVTKVVAVDRDSGQNAWLSYRLLKASEPGLFSVGLHTGEVRTARALLDRDALKQSLVVAVQDHGQPPLSATVTLTVAVADSIPEVLADLGSFKPSANPDDSGLTLYLVVAVAAVSCVFLAFVIVLLAFRLRRWHRSHLLQASGGSLAGVPASHFVGMDGVQAFLQTYSHEVSLTADSRKSHLIFPQPNYADTLISQESCEKSEPLLVTQDLLETKGDPNVHQVQRRARRHLRRFLEGNFLLIATALRRPVQIRLQKRKAGTVSLPRIVPSTESLFLLPTKEQSSRGGKQRMRPSAERSSQLRWRQVLLSFLLSLFRGALPDQIRYSVPEELAKNSVVGNLAKDLGLSVRDLPARKLRVSAEKEYFTVNPESGDLLVSDRIDREQICGMKPLCILDFDTVAENPLNIFRVAVTVQDINDNIPLFKQRKIDLKIGESTKPGRTFPLDPALDLDAGSNSLQRYHLSDNEYFDLAEKQAPDGRKYPELILKHSLDREEQNFHQLVLTAVDGGDPPQSGTTQIQIQVIDANDNPPVFSQDVYRVSLQEGVPRGFSVLRVTATDQDEGVNAEVTYSFHNVDEQVEQFFTLDKRTGEIKTKNDFDFEVASSYTLGIEAKDPGELAAHCSIQVEILDENDCAPEVIVTSVFTPLPEDSPPGTVIALIKTRDRDSGENGDVYCRILGKTEFLLKSYSKDYYKLVTDRALDREEIPEYNVTILATDRGKPPLSSSTTITLQITDVNDNAPVFQQSAYLVHVPENNPPGASIAQVSASDPDMGPNGHVSYSIAASDLEPRALSSYVSVSAHSGVVFAQRAFDHEQLRAFELTLQARDQGSPALSANVSLRVLVGDRNDNAPRVLYPALGPEGSALFDTVPRAAQPGYLVTKVVAVDADSGHNAWLSYHVLQASEPGLFSLGLRTGEVRTARALGDRDAARQRLLVAVRDGGQPPLSATATLLLVFADSLQEALPDLSDHPTPSDPQAELQFYLVVALALISVLFLLAVILAVALRLRSSSSPASWSCFQPGLSSKPGPGVLPNYSEGTLPYSYNLCVASQSAKTEFNFLNVTPEVAPPQDLLCEDACWVPSTNHGDADGPLASDTILKQAPPNTDWRFSQAQRPGTSGSQNGDETGTWPNNQFDTEMLQAMILASASEAADGSSTLGGGAGTMGLSARYGPQFTLQHVPDYRQNVYIPGSNATLTNAAGKRDGKAPAGGNGNKKKSGKKEKK
ncbi:protocadherin gamma-B2 isoform 1-T1 [Hipposideros larvatus]